VVAPRVGTYRDAMEAREGSTISPVDSPPTDEVMRVAEFRAALRRFLRQSEHAARASGLTPQRHLLLVMIKGAPDGSERATITQLAERLQLAQSTVTELVGRAEEVGLVKRAQSETDARVSVLRLTEEGERRLAGSFRGHDAERVELRRAISRLR
jgi:DNA-binding MarR family transcriptional regulator